MHTRYSVDLCLQDGYSMCKRDKLYVVGVDEMVIVEVEVQESAVSMYPNPNPVHRIYQSIASL
jgi:hypothetical protein